MAVALYPFQKLQVGRETVFGTGVAATRVIACDGVVREMANRYMSTYPRGIRGARGGTGTDIQNWCDFDLTMELGPQTILWPLLTGLEGNITAVAGGGGDIDAKTWTADLAVTALPALDSMTMEFVQSDGSTNHIQTESRGAYTSGIAIDIAAESVATVKWTGFGRKRQSDTPTGALGEYTNHAANIMVGPSSGLYVDSTWAGLGTTLMSGIVRSVNVNVDTGVKPDWVLDFRADRDYGAARTGVPAITLTAVLELNATAAAEYAAWRAKTTRFYQIKTISSNNIGVSTVPYTIKINGNFRLTESPSFSQEDDYVLMTLNAEAHYDTVSGNTFQVAVINDLAAVANL